MNDWKIIDHTRNRELYADSRKEGREKLEDFEGQMELELLYPNGDTLFVNWDDNKKPHYSDEGTQDIEPDVEDQTEAKADGGAVEVVEESEESETAPGPPEPKEDDVITGMDDLRDNHPDLLPDTVPLQDPLSMLPGWMITEVSYSDRGDTSTTVNKRGCQVIARALNLQVETDAETRASETDFEYAEFKAVAKRPDGQEFTGYGTARADGVDQSEDAGWKLDMQAETRAYKRAVKNATGGGIEAFAKEGGQ